jgi:hypothetical protein
MVHLLILSWKGIARSDVMEGHYYFIPIHRTGSRVSARRGCEAPARSAASTNAMAAACPRQPTPPRGPASAPRTVRPGATPRARHAPPHRRGANAGAVVPGGGARGDEDARHVVRDAAGERHHGRVHRRRPRHHLRALRGALAPAPQDRHHRAPQRAPGALVPRRPRGGGCRHAARRRRRRRRGRAPRPDVRAVIGDRCKDRDLFLRQVDRINKLAAGFNPADLWSSSGIARRLSGAVRRDTVFRILDGTVKEHLERLGCSRGGREAEDLLEVLLKIQRDGGLPIPLDMDVIKYVIFVSISSLAR